jgi:serine/threonine protein kinase
LAQDNLKNYFSSSNIGDIKNEENNDEKANNSNNKRVIILRNHLRSKQKLRQEFLSSGKPDDVVNASMINTKLDIQIDNDIIKKNTLLYEQIQRKLKKILSKGKLPVFNIDNYIIGKQIGDGSFGTIFETTNNKTQMKYALKKIVTSDINNLEKYQKEFEIVHQSTHPNILDIHGICFRCFDQTTFIIYVLMDLAKYDWEVEINYRKKENKNYYSEKQLIHILKQLSSALLFLQKDKSISHRDIKPENILVFKNDIYKLSDFGEADNDAKTDDRQKTLRGTELYMSPLLHQGLMSDADYIIHNTFKSDVFSLGCCLIIAASLDFEVIGEIRKLQRLYSIKNYLIKLFNKRYSKQFIELLLKMINFNEKERFDFIQLDDYIKKSFQD